eukprot:COSAG01_NODE_66835_length_268_cov_66.786982_1_plen_32_part_10
MAGWLDALHSMPGCNRSFAQASALHAHAGWHK